MNEIFSNVREMKQPEFDLQNLKIDSKQQMDGLIMLKQIPDKVISLVFFDPQYRSILDKQNYGNEKTGKGRARASLAQMDDKIINDFLKEIERILLPSGHLMFWVDKLILCSTATSFLNKTNLKLVDMITWNKKRMGMGYRTRRCSEYLLICQNPPLKAKGVWTIHNIPDVWDEKIINSKHPHTKPIGLQERLIEAVSNEKDIIVDPSAGSYSVMEAAKNKNRKFLGCDINDVNYEYRRQTKKSI